MPKTRTLKDLYVVGEEFTLDDGAGGVTVWLQKLNPVDHETALRKANAKRARIMSMSKLPSDSDERAEYMNQLFDMAADRDATINFLVQERIAERFAIIEAEVAAEDEWSKDDYLQGLKDSWDNEMYERFVKASSPEDQEDAAYIEAATVKSELERFNEQVTKIVTGEMDAMRKDYADVSYEKLIEDGINRIIASNANMGWLMEFRKCEIWLGVRHPKKVDGVYPRYFSHRSDVDDLSSEVLGELMAAYTNLNVDSTEGKD